MLADLLQPPWTRREVARRGVGWLSGLFIKAYGVAAALSVALSDSDTVGGKAEDAVAAVPNLLDRYREVKYLVEHQAEIQDAVDYVNQNAPDEEQLRATADETTETLDGLQETYSELLEARDAFPGLNPFDWEVREGVGHVQDAWDAKPDLDSIGELAGVAEQVGPFVDQVEILLPVFYSGLLTILDNFGEDEIVGTLFVMGCALAVAFALAACVGFWARRGQPGLLARALQRAGARVFRGWYVENLEHALGGSLYAAARERIQGDVVADPERALDPDEFRQLERYFERRVSRSV